MDLGCGHHERHQRSFEQHYGQGNHKPGSEVIQPNKSRQPTPEVRLAAYRASLARRGCALRSVALTSGIDSGGFAGDFPLFLLSAFCFVSVVALLVSAFQLLPKCGFGRLCRVLEWSLGVASG